jgi:N-acetylmuramoyl-L-alanine amidase
MINWTHIMLHHSFSPDRTASDWEAIRRFHMSWKYRGDIIPVASAKALLAQHKTGVEAPWKDIGYHFGVELIEEAYQLREGRSLSTPGAHCKEGSMNRQSIGICCVGNFDPAPPPELQLVCLRKLVVDLQNQFAIPSSRIVLHREYATYKTCPGKLFPIEEFLSSLQNN